MEEITRITGIESLRTLYRGFYDENWGAEFRFALQDTKLWEAGVDLTRNWLAASQARSWPWLMVEMVDASLVRSLEEAVPFSTRKIRFIRNYLASHLKASGESARPAFYRKLEAALVDLDTHATRSMETARKQVLSDMDDVWQQLVPVPMFHNMIWSSERSAYVALYYNYECFLKESVRRARDADTYQWNAADLSTVFGTVLGPQCTNDIELQIAKHARTSLAHNGGQMIKQLKNLPHRHRLEDNEIQIGASETTRLYHLLKDKAMLLAKAAKSIEALELPAPEEPLAGGG